MGNLSIIISTKTLLLIQNFKIKKKIFVFKSFGNVKIKVSSAIPIVNSYIPDLLTVELILL